MDKYTDNTLVEPMDDIILINDNYADQGLFKGYIGITVASFLPKWDYILVDFLNPVKGEYLVVQAKIKKDDFRVFSDSLEDKLAGKAFRELFKNK